MKTTVAGLNYERANISIITPVYNSGLFLIELVHAIRRQHLQPLELILVDDGSDIATRQQIAYLADAYPDLIRPLFQPHNQGPGVARNRAIVEAKGDFIILIDSDDFPADPDVLLDLDTQIREKQFDMLAFKSARYSTDKLTGMSRAFPWFIELAEGHGFEATSVANIADILIGKYLTNYLYRKQFLLEHGKMFDPRVGRREDYPFLFPNLLRSRNLKGIDRVCYGYRQNPKSTMFTPNLEDLLSQMIGYSIIREEFNTTGNADVPLRHFLDLVYLRSFFSQGSLELAKDPKANLSPSLELLKETFLKTDGEKPLTFREKLAKCPSVQGKQMSSTQRMKHSWFKQINPLQLQYEAILRGDSVVYEELNRLVPLRKKERRSDPAWMTFGPVQKPKDFDPAGRTLFLHVGLTKTGTTSIQTYFNENRSSLNDTVCFPEAGLEFDDGYDRTSGHHSFFWAIRQGSDLKLQVKMMREIGESAAKKVLLSAEVLSWDEACRTPQYLETLRQAFVGFDIKIILTYRDPLARFLSQYKEDIRQKGRGYAGDPLTYFRDSVETDTWDHTKMIEIYKDIFGSENCIALDYEAVGSNLLDVFLKAIDPTILLPVSGCNQTKHSNLSISDTDAAERRLLGLLVRSPLVLSQGMGTVIEQKQAITRAKERADCLLMELEALRKGMGYADLVDDDRAAYRRRLYDLFGDETVAALSERILKIQGTLPGDVQIEAGGKRKKGKNLEKFIAELKLGDLFRGRRRLKVKDIAVGGLMVMGLQYMWLLTR